MTVPEDRSVEERLRALEAAVEHLRETVKGLISAVARREAEAHGHPAPVVRDVTRPAPLPRRGPEGALAPKPGPFATLLDRGPQYWISRVGIGLLLAGVAFLFKYAVDRGWLGPMIRVAFGLGLGATLAAIGFRVQARQRWFSQIMLGGAIATWYITGFAAFQLLHVVSYPVAFAFMVLVTLFAFWAGVRQDEAALAGLAAIGGLGTPFFLYTEAGSVPSLMAYSSVLLLGTSAIYLFRGWRSLLWLTAAGGWLVLALGFDTGTPANRLALQAGILVLWLLFWLVPTAREVLAGRDLSRWTRAPGLVMQPGGAVGERFAQLDLALLVLATAVATLFASRAVWAAGDRFWGVIALAGAAVYAAGTWRLRREGEAGVLASAHAVTGAVLTAAAIALLTHGHVQIVLWAVEAAVLHVLATRLDDRAVRAVAHALFAIVAFWLLQRIAGGPRPDPAVLNPRALADLGVIAAGLAASWWVEQRATSWYRLIAHAAILGWLWRDLSALPAGGGIATAAWGVYGLALLLFLKRARNVGLATLFLAAAKLVIVDLSQVDPVWRILLSLGFGAVFLAISYRFRSLWGHSTGEGDLKD
jgi:uncharacterized membrane protein